jgi:hypothetical protein
MKTLEKEDPNREIIENYIKSLEDSLALEQEAIDIAKDSYEQLEEMNEQAEESYWALYAEASNAIVSELEKEISI